MSAFSADLLAAGKSVGVDVAALHRKYATQKMVDQLGAGDVEARLKAKARTEAAARMRGNVAEFSALPEQALHSPSADSKVSAGHTSHDPIVCPKSFSKSWSLSTNSLPSS